jgi:glutamate carboxypeptidase
MKAGLVQMLHAMGSHSSRELIETEATGARAALVAEPSADGAIKIERKGVSAYELEVIGRAAHAGLEPERGVNAAAELVLHGGPNRPPLEAAMSEPLVAVCRRAAAAIGIGALRTVSVGGGSDGNFTAGVGTLTLDGLGAVGGGAHSDDEHVLVDSMAERAALLAALLSLLLESD